MSNYKISSKFSNKKQDDCILQIILFYSGLSWRTLQNKLELLLEKRNFSGRNVVKSADQTDFAFINHFP